MKKCRSVRVSGLLYTWFVTIASFSSFSFVLCLAFHHPFARHPPFGGSNIEQPRLVAVYRYDCRGGNPMIMRVRSRVGPDVIFKVISSHLIRLATCVFRRLVGQGPRDRCVSITMPLSPRFYHPSRTSDRAIYFSIIYTYRYMYIYIYRDFSEWYLFRVEKLTRLYIFSIRICEFFSRNRKFVSLSEPQSNEWHDEFMSRGCFIDCYEWKLFAVMKVAGV